MPKLWTITLRIIDSNHCYHWHTIKTFTDEAENIDDQNHLHNVKFETLAYNAKPFVELKLKELSNITIKDLKLFYSHNIKSEDFNFHIDKNTLNYISN